MTADTAILVHTVLYTLGQPQKSHLLLHDIAAAKCKLETPINNGMPEFQDEHWNSCRELFAEGKMLTCDKGASNSIS
jgi:hypothetical protein